MRFHKDYLWWVGFNPKTLKEIGINTEIADEFLYLTNEEYLLLKLMLKVDLLNLEGHWTFHRCEFTELPDNLTVENSLNLNRIPLKALPKNLTVGGHLHIAYTNISKIPDCLTVGGKIVHSKEQFMFPKSNLVLKKVN